MNGQGGGNFSQNRRNYPSFQMNQPPPAQAPPPSQPPLPKNPHPNEPSEEEKFFDDQFKKWEEEFECWKKQNANHPDKKAYAEYEKKFTDVRAKLLERREQMRRKKRESQKNQSSNITIKMENSENEEAHPAVWQPQPISNKSSEPLKPESIFLSSNSSGSIPGLGGFDESESIKREPEETEPSSKNSTPGKSTTKPLLDLTENIQNAPQTNDVRKQLELLLENSQVSALLTLVNLTNEHPNSIQLNALKPIIEALKQLTQKGDKEIMKALAEVSMKLNNYEPEKEIKSEFPTSTQSTPSTPQQSPYVHVAASGITVIPPLNQPETQYPSMMQPPPMMEQQWMGFDSPTTNNWGQNLGELKFLFYV